MFRHLTFGSGRKIGVHIASANAVHPDREFRRTRSQHQRMQPVWNEITEQTGTIGEVFAPSVKLFRAKRRSLLDWPKPALPINIFRRRFRFDQIIPFTGHTVPAIITLAPDQGAKFARLDKFTAFAPTGSGTALRTYLVNFAGALDFIVDFKCFVQVASHWFLTVDVFASIQCVQSDGLMVWIMGRD